MSVIKPRTRGKHFVEHRMRLDRENHETLYAYAAFLDEDADYVVNQLIEGVLEKDREFAAWRADHRQTYAPQRLVRIQRVNRATPPSVATSVTGAPNRVALSLRE